MLVAGQRKRQAEAQAPEGGLAAAAPGYSSAPPSGSLVSGREPSMVQSVSRVKR